ncbi:MAG: hypothetical protein GF372_10375 [Candidatus Marinimicrobia bacterium]|nr:hypothetical protein [Candidatus Neomarinimicrobiota bacterium]
MDFYRKIFLGIFTILLIAGCNENPLEPVEGGIIGSWYMEDMLKAGSLIDRDVNTRFIYHFEYDGTFSSLRTYSDAETDSLLGYGFAAEGEYITKGDTLTMITLERMTSAQVSQAPYIKNRPEPVSIQLETLQVEYLASRNLLIFDYFPCDAKDLIQCVDKQVFVRAAIASEGT